MKAQWRAALANPNNPEMIISNGAVGADLALWYFSKSGMGGKYEVCC